MKTPLFILTGLFLLSGAARAQTNNSQYDHTYSTHNYKHANKAVEAHKRKRQAGMSVVVTASQVAAANYKQPQPGNPQTSGISVLSYGPTPVARHNYKAGYRPLVLPEQTRYVNRTDAKQPTDKTVSGEE